MTPMNEPLVLGIETSCDETAVAIVECTHSTHSSGPAGGTESPTFRVLGNALYSQASEHEEWGGVYPNLAKRLHAKNIVPMLKEALKEAEELHSKFEAPASRQGRRNPKKIQNTKYQKIKIYRETQNTPSINDSRETNA